MKRYRKYFKKAVEAYFPQEAESLIDEANDAFQALQKDIQFAASSKNPMDRRLDISAYFLAFIKVLNQQGESYEKIREICLEIANDYVRPKRKSRLSSRNFPQN